jgi:hypothetical protein
MDNLNMAAIKLVPPVFKALCHIIGAYASEKGFELEIFGDKNFDLRIHGANRTVHCIEGELGIEDAADPYAWLESEPIDTAVAGWERELAALMGGPLGE